MRYKIFKYTLDDPKETTVLHLPKDAEILCVKAQHGRPQL